MDGEAIAWFDRELAGVSLADVRLNKRLRKLVAQIGSAVGESIPLVCQDWANTKAAYRFFSNDRVSEADILTGHFQSTRESRDCHSTVPFSCSTIRPSSAIKERTRTRSGSPRASTVGGTRRVA